MCTGRPLLLNWRYPTDISLLNEAKEKTDELIDALHAPLIGKAPRPRTYRVKARRRFVAFTKHKKPGQKKIRRAKREQLGFLGRNFKAIDRLLETPEALPLGGLSRRQYKNLLVARELFRQQLEMVKNQSNRVDNRIVSISQSHVRPIVRGKAGRPTEFGAKLSISADPLCVPYLDPGVVLARVVRKRLDEYLDKFGSPPKTIYMQNHGFIALGSSAKQVKAITAMAIKAAKDLDWHLCFRRPPSDGRRQRRADQNALRRTLSTADYRRQLASRLRSYCGISPCSVAC